MENKFGNTSPEVQVVSRVPDTELGTTEKVAPKAYMAAFGAAKAVVPHMIAAAELLAEALTQFGFAEAAWALRIGVWILRALTSGVAVRAFGMILRAARGLGAGLARLGRGIAQLSGRLVHAVRHGMRFLARRSHVGWRRLRTLVRRRRHRCRR
ncbi:hypothetical protein ACFWPX_33355 [Nocardia sp. NPDC058518]|uniref:hypothetical protein n=1 Tax=Nocardia sp. NPDC058518 TaxID=3346534 RepID=UPI0036620271